MLYWILARIIKVVLMVFFRRIEAHGMEKIPDGHPLVFIANHPNMALDPFLVGLHHKDPIHFLAKSGLFHPAPVGWLLRYCGVVPVYRRSDDPAQTGKNQDMFRECYDILEHKGSICLFPEGGSFSVPHLSPFKTGAARIVLEAEEKNAYGLGVRIVPVGLHYVTRHEFRSDVLVQFGDPIDPTAYFAAYEKDKAEAVHRLTQSMQDTLMSLTENLQQNQDWNVVRKLKKIYTEGFLDSTARPANLKDTFDLDRGLIEAHAHFLAQQPERTGRVTEDIESYLFIIQMLGLSDYAFIGGKRRDVILRLLVEMPLLIVFGIPIVLYGIATNYLPYRLVGRVTDRITHDPVEPATYKIGLGGLFHGTYYTLLAALVGWKWGLASAIVAFLSFPVAGLLTLELYDRLSRNFRTLLTLYIFRMDEQLASRLSTLRSRIMQELAALRDEWLRTEKSAPQAAEN
jgi:glycerol-3-phosphate O-acyltransferase/dihydroxyacetone phosphate acyltransferase